MLNTKTSAYHLCSASLINTKKKSVAEKRLCNSKRNQGQPEVGKRTGLPCTCK